MPGEEARTVRSQMLRRLLGFAGLPLLSLLTPFLLLPIIARTGNANTWVALNLGQSVGALAAVLASLGWTLSGPAAVAAASTSDRSRIYADSLASRVPVTVLAAAAGAALCIPLVGSEGRLTAVAMTVAMTATALSPTWYSIGIGSARLIAVYETFPRLAATAVSAVVILTTGAVWFYPVALLAVVLAGTGAFGARVVGIGPREVDWLQGPRSIWAMRTSTATVATASSYALTPMPLATVFATTSEAASFGSADRLFRFALMAVQVCMNAFQSWVVDPASGRLDPRHVRAAAAVTMAIGGAGLVVFAAAGPGISGLLFGTPLASDPLVAVFYGVAVLAVAASSVLGRLILIPSGRGSAVFGSTVAGAVIGLTCMLALGAAGGATGVAAGFAASEVAVAAYQAGVLLARRKVPLKR